ncbi:MAG: hypothetical protein ACREC9_11390 [Methylocella sp.]
MKRSAIVGLTIFAAIAVSMAPAVALKQPVTTYHYDNQRTGWNGNETTLTPTNVGPTSFGVVAEVVLDDQVDAQPLVVPNQQITSGIYTVGPPGIYQVVYVATEGNTIYGIRAAIGEVVLKRNLGPPVPLPLGCTNNGPNVGITGTPVIDVTAQTLYVVAYVNGSPPTYQLHALNLSDLTDKPGSPVTVAASHTLTDRSTTTFDATVERQRAALLESSGIIYAGFGAFCDFAAGQSRGWLLGWQAGTLAPLAANTLTDTQATDTGNFFLSGIWMSGYGIAAAPISGKLFFSTGNSDPNQDTYDGKTNIQESVVKVGPHLVNLLSIFTPSNENLLDRLDSDLASGGVLIVPIQPGPLPYLAVAAGKFGTMYLLNRSSLGGFTPGGPDNVVDSKFIGHCWCGPSYFTGPDGVGRVVSSGGGDGSSRAQITVWKIQTSPTVAFVQEGTASLPGGAGAQDPGTFTTVSSNGIQPGTAIIWATGRPTVANPTTITLSAFSATPTSGMLPLLFSSPAGSWPNSNGNANIVPVVANGHVFVASNQQLTIFGLGGHPFVARAAAAAEPAALNTPKSPHEITGVLEHAEGPVLTLRTRAGNIVRVDQSDARRRGQIGVLVQGQAYTVEGTIYDATGALHAQTVARAKASPAIWPQDR